MNTFTKANLVERIVESNDIESKAAAKRVLELIIEVVKERTAAGDKVDISGLCSFKPTIQAARSGINQLTGKPYNSPVKKIVKIKPSASFKKLMVDS